MINREERGNIVVLTMAHGKANALDLELADELLSHFKVSDSASPSTIVLTGAVPSSPRGLTSFACSGKTRSISGDSCRHSAPR